MIAVYACGDALAGPVAGPTEGFSHTPCPVAGHDKVYLFIGFHGGTKWSLSILRVQGRDPIEFICSLCPMAGPDDMLRCPMAGHPRACLIYVHRRYNGGLIRSDQLYCLQRASTLTNLNSCHHYESGKKDRGYARRR